MADDEPHAVVRLLLKRMESHPEEFETGGDGRWAEWLDELIPFTTEAERVLLRGPMMQHIHEQVMDELLNGEERRRKEAEDREFERHLAHAARQQALAQQQKAYGGGGGAGLAQRAYDYDLDRYRGAGVTHIAGQGPSLKAGLTTGTITNAAPPKLSPYDKIMNALKKGK
jgi:hypothetical protein